MLKLKRRQPDAAGGPDVRVHDPKHARWNAVAVAAEHCYEDHGKTFQFSTAYDVDVLMQQRLSRKRNAQGTTRKNELPPRQQEPSFSMEEVKAIVACAVKDRESELREEFEETLLMRLDEQWKQFATFNEQEIHRRMETSQHDYFC